MRRSFFCVDAHTCGNPVRMVVGGGPALPHVPMAEKRMIFLAHHDWVRRALMFEPRGHDQMSGAILYPPSRDDCEMAILFVEVSGCLPMCGHDTIGAVTVAIEEGLISPRVPGQLSIETPAGRVDVTYRMEGNRVTEVRLFNVPSFLHASDITVDVEGLGRLTLDVSYGGNFYAIVEPQGNWQGLDTCTASELIALSPRVRTAAEAAVTPVHPEDPRIQGVSHVMWCDRPRDPKASARNAVFYGEKAIDRSPCGTGSSARMAQLASKGLLDIGETFVHESIIGTLFNCRIESETTLGDFAAISPSVAGWAKITGHNTIFVDDDDPLAHGFQLM